MKAHQKIHHFIARLILLGVVGFVSGLAKADGPPGMPQLMDEQRSCMQKKMGNPGSGARPSREQMESVFKECGITPPSGPPSRRSESSPEPTDTRTRIDPTKVISGLRSLRGESNDYLRLDGRIPRACREKIGVSMTCSEQDRVTFTIRETIQDGFQCLKDNQNKCREGAPANGCVSMDSLMRDAQLKSNFVARLDSTVADQSCKRVDIAAAQVSIQKRYFDPAFARTEGGVCVQCATARNEQLSRLEAQVKELKATVDRQQEMLARKPDGPPGGRDRMALGGRRPPRDDVDADDEDMPLPPRRAGGRGDTTGMGGMNMADMGGMSMMGMGGMGGMGGMSMMGMGGMSSMYRSYSPYMSMMSSPMMGYSGMNMMGYGGMSNIYRSPYMTSYSPYMNMYSGGMYSPYMNYGYGNTGYLNSTLSHYYRSPFTQTSTPYIGNYLNFGIGGTAGLYSPYTYTGYGR